MNIDAIRSSWAQVVALGDLAAKHFYATLFLLAPETRPLFPHSMSAQNDKLLAALGHIVANVDRPDQVAAYAARLGAEHRRFDVRPEHYAVLSRALLSTLEKLLGPAWTPELSRDWREAYQIVANLMIDGAAAAARTEPARWRCKVVEVVRPTNDVAVFTVQPDYPLPYQPGQSTPIRGPRTQRWRYLTPANAPRSDTTIEYHVRAVGADSAALVSRLDVGDEIDAGRPAGDSLTLDENSRAPVVMIAGGTGLAPMCALIDAMAARRPRPTWLVFGAATPGGLYYHYRLVHLAERLPWLTYLPTVESGPGWVGRVGTAAETAIADTGLRGADVLVCGSPAMVRATTMRLAQHGVPAHRIRTDSLAVTAYPRLNSSQWQGEP